MLVRRMDFVHRQAEMGRLIYQIKYAKKLKESEKVEEVENWKNQTPASVVINLDQVTLKFVPGCNRTIAQKEAKMFRLLDGMIRQS